MKVNQFSLKTNSTSFWILGIYYLPYPCNHIVSECPWYWRMETASKTSFGSREEVGVGRCWCDKCDCSYKCQGSSRYREMAATSCCCSKGKILSFKIYRNQKCLKTFYQPPSLIYTLTLIVWGVDCLFTFQTAISPWKKGKIFRLFLLHNELSENLDSAGTITIKQHPEPPHNTKCTQQGLT